MKNKIKVGIIVVLMIVFGYCIVSNAAISVDSKQVNSGEEFTISIKSDVSLASYSIKAETYSGLTFVTSTGGTGAGTVSVSNALATGGITDLATFTFKTPEVTEDTKYTIKFVATGMGDEELKTVADSNATATITVSAPEPIKPEEPIQPEQTPNDVEPQPEEPTNTTEPEKPTNEVEPEKPTTVKPEPEEKPEPTKSSDATLKMLGIGNSAKNPSKYDFSGFKSSKLNYSITVPYNVEGLEVYYTVNDSKAKCEISGNTGFDVGENTIKVNVTAEDGTQKTYTIKVTREEEKSGDATLSNLGIGKSAKEASEYDFSGFTKNTYEYSIEVPYEVTSLDVYYKVSKSTSIADVSGSSNFNVGENEIKVLVTAEDGTQKTYTIKVTRLEKNDANVSVDNKPNEDGQIEPEGNETEETTNQKETALQLEKLEVSKGKLSPEFDGKVTEYTLTVGSSVENLDITCIANKEDAEIEIAGNEGLKEGENTITILLRNSDDSEIITYQIKVTKKNGFDFAGFISNKENQNIMIILGIILIFIIVIIILLVKDSDDEDDFEDKKIKTKKSKAKRFKNDYENMDKSEEKEIENINNN